MFGYVLAIACGTLVSTATVLALKAKALHKASRDFTQGPPCVKSEADV